MRLVNRSILSVLVFVLLLANHAMAQIEGAPPSAPPTSTGTYNVNWGLYYLQESNDGISWRIVSNFASAPASMTFSKPPGTYYYRTYYMVGAPVFLSVISAPIQVRVTPAGATMLESGSELLTF